MAQFFRALLSLTTALLILVFLAAFAYIQCRVRP